MARIAGVELPHHKRMEIALTYIYGIGRSAAQKILAEAKVDPARNSDELTPEEQVHIRNVIDEIEISYDADPLDVTLLVQDALDRNALISDDSDVVVDTADNTVTLTGHVRTWAEHDAAVGAAWMAGGVFQVRDDLVITG